LGAAIYEQTSGAPQSASARLRIELIASEITRLARSSPIRVASYACGHARELEQLAATTAARVELFMALDADERSLAEARCSAGAIAFEGHRCNVIKQDLSALQPCTLVYSLGLFDYLNDEHAVQVIRKMLAQTAAGGTLLLANLAPTAANLAYCEAIMDWWMIPRSASDLLALAQTALGQAPAQTSVEQHGCFNYLRIQPVANAA
jgi:extracellular factor (EF) 3-hydroxypalmitic acid methyl ester biosynthesis protein